jgi:hypothetical protein
MQQFFNGVPQYVWDAGVTLNFQITGFAPALGSFHRPINVSAFATEEGAATPPVKWTEYDNLDSWAEMIKYSYRPGRNPYGHYPSGHRRSWDQRWLHPPRLRMQG